MSTTDRQCPRCGTHFQLNQPVCPNCHTPYPADPYQAPSPYTPSGLDATVAAKIPSNLQQQGSSDHNAETVAASPYTHSNPYVQTNPYASGEQDSTIPVAYPGQQAPIPPAQPVYPGQQGPVGYPQNAPYPYPQPGQQGPYPYPLYPQKKPASAGKILLIIGSVFLAVVVVVCSVAVLLEKSLGNHSASGTSTPTAISTPIATTPQATSSSSGSNSGSGSSTTQGDVPAPTGQALFSDDFTNNNHNWETGQRTNYSISVDNKGLTIQDSNNEYLTEIVPGSDQWTDYRMDLTYTPNLPGDNDQAGIIFRGQQTNAQEGPKGYLLKIDNQGDYVIRKITTPATASNQAVYTDLQQGQTDPPLLIGDPVNITLMVKGNATTLYLNGKYMTSTTDSSSPFTAGDLELFVESTKQGTATSATFTHIDVYPAPDTLPSV